MSELLELEQAKATFDTICQMLDGKDWKYERIDEKLIIQSGVQGDDLPIKFTIKVNPRNQIVALYSMMPFNVPEDKRVEMALAIHVANYPMVDGSFDYDIKDGSIIFRLTTSFRDSILSKELFEYMLMVSVVTIDEYNDKFFAVSKGLMSLEQFIEHVQKD